jgi:predicted nucleic acid-binding protein
MKRFLLDTGVAGDFIDRRHGVYERAREEVAKGNRIGIGIPVLAELAYGIELSKSRDRNVQSLQTALAVWKVWPFDETGGVRVWTTRGGVAADRASDANVGHHDRRHRPLAWELHGGFD